MPINKSRSAVTRQALYSSRKSSTGKFVSVSNTNGRFSATVTHLGKGANRRVKDGNDAASLRPEYGSRIRNVVAILGTNAALAEILAVSRSRITKWVSGLEYPSDNNAREILDLDHIIARASLVLHRDEIKNWLTSPNPFVPGHASPLSAIRTGHVDDALSALEAESEGAYF